VDRPRSVYDRLTLRDRFLSWLVTGPVGRFVAFFLDLGALIVRTVVRRGS
jgi:hypothetical protein